MNKTVFRFSRIFITIIISLSLIFSFIIPVFADTVNITIDDEANLLTYSEKEELAQIMLDISEYTYVAFVSGYGIGYQTKFYAEKKYRELIGYHSSGILFCIDMYNREIYIFSDGDAHKKINRFKAEEITDNVYRYASNGQYYECAKNAFLQIYATIQGEAIFSPVKIFTNFLIAFGISLAFFNIVVYNQRKKEVELIPIMFANDSHVVKDLHIVMTKQKYKVYNPDTGGSGSHSSGGRSGGHSSGGHSSGGHSSGGGGGHRF